LPRRKVSLNNNNMKIYLSERPELGLGEKNLGGPFKNHTKKGNEWELSREKGNPNHRHCQFLGTMGEVKAI